MVVDVGKRWDKLPATRKDVSGSPVVGSQIRQIRRAGQTVGGGAELRFSTGAQSPEQRC